jgi:hypothetical protein
MSMSGRLLPSEGAVEKRKWQRLAGALWWGRGRVQKDMQDVREKAVPLQCWF